MPVNEQNEDKENSNSLNSYGKFTGIAFQMVAVIGIFAFAGYKIDGAFEHQVKWATAALSLTGVFIALYIVIKSIKS